MDNELNRLIKCFFTDYKNEGNVASGKVKEKYAISPDAIENAFGKQYTDIIAHVGIGAGNLARCPYIIFMDPQITKTATMGIYVVIIFKENMSGFYLMINQGVTFLQYTNKTFQNIRSYWCDRLGIEQENEKIELAKNPTKLVQDYQKAYIIAEEFNRDFEEAEFSKKLENYLKYYKRISSIIRSEFQNDIVRMYETASKEAKDNSILEIARLKESKQEKNRKELLDDFIKDLNGDIEKTKGVVFFLGAGISCALGVPDWNTLVFNLLCEKWDFQKPDISQEKIMDYVKKYSSPTALAAMVKNQYEEDEQFIKSIHNIFYGNEIGKEKLLQSPIGKIARKITARSTGTKAVITFNFDDFLERAMDYIECQNEYEVICHGNENKVYQGNKLPIYHVHGYIPQDGLGKKRSNIVFTEKEYHGLYSDFYNWTNIIQTKYLMDYTCIFLGLSFSDPNQRRILENVSPFIPDDRFNYLIVGNVLPKEEAMQKCDKELNLLNSAWNEKNYRLKTFYINEMDYRKVNERLKEIIDMIK